MSMCIYKHIDTHTYIHICIYAHIDVYEHMTQPYMDLYKSGQRAPWKHLLPFLHETLPRLSA